METYFKWCALVYRQEIKEFFERDPSHLRTILSELSKFCKKTGHVNRKKENFYTDKKQRLSGAKILFVDIRTLFIHQEMPFATFEYTTIQLFDLFPEFRVFCNDWKETEGGCYVNIDNHRLYLEHLKNKKT